MTDSLIAANYYASRGWPVLPLHGLVDDACTCGDVACSPKNRGKHPATPHGHKDATTDVDQIRAWFDNDLTRNIGIATGRVSGLVVIDIDPRNGGFDSWDEFEGIFGDVDFATYTVNTGGGGIHLYYAYPDDLAVASIPALLRGVDLKADGGYVVAPPSTHIIGGVYATVRHGLDVAPLPEPLRSIISSGQRPAGLSRTATTGTLAIGTAGLSADRQREILADPSTLGPGERDTFFTFAARDLRRGGLEFAEIMATLVPVWEAMANPPEDYFSPEALLGKVRRAVDTVEVEFDAVSQEIANRLVASAREAYARTDAGIAAAADTLPVPSSLAIPASRVIMPDGYTLPKEIFAHWNGEMPEGWMANDEGCARLAQMQWGHVIRYDRDTEDWLAYDDEQQIWVRNAEHEVTRMVLFSVRSLERVVALDIADDKERTMLVQYACRQGNAGNIRSIMNLLKVRDGISVHHDVFDQATTVLPVENGVVDPSAYSYDMDYDDVIVRPHSPEDLFTLHSEFRWDDYTYCPQWDEAVSRWFPDPGIRTYAQRLMGYAVFGSGREKIFVIGFGPANSGKSAFFNCIRDMLGTFAVDVESKSFLKRKTEDTARYDLGHIGGARLLLGGETNPGAKFDTALLKTLSSGGEDTIRARLMRENFVTIRNKGLLVIMTNYIPRAELDPALWRRLLVLPFENYFPEESPDVYKTDKLKSLLTSEREGVLRWIVEGYLDYRLRGIAPPDKVTGKLAEVKEADDWLQPYIDHQLVLDPTAREKMGVIIADYRSWSSADPEARTNKEFSAALGERLKKRRSTGGYWYLFGAKLRQPVPEPATEIPASWAS